MRTTGQLKIFATHNSGVLNSEEFKSLSNWHKNFWGKLNGFNRGNNTTLSVTEYVNLLREFNLLKEVFEKVREHVPGNNRIEFNDFKLFRWHCQRRMLVVSIYRNDQECSFAKHFGPFRQVFICLKCKKIKDKTLPFRWLGPTR